MPHFSSPTHAPSYATALHAAMLYTGTDRAEKNRAVADGVNRAIREITTRLNSRHLVEHERPIIEGLLGILRLQYVVLLTTDPTEYEKSFLDMQQRHAHVQQQYQLLQQRVQD